MTTHDETLGTYQGFYAGSIADPKTFWGRQAKLIDWHKPPRTILEYTKPHLEWQLQRAGFRDVEVTLQQFHHQPHRLAARVLSWAFYPLFIVPRFRDNLVAIARAPDVLAGKVRGRLVVDVNR